LLVINPFMPILDLFRRAVGQPVALGDGGLGFATASLLLVFMAGILLFRGLVRDVADEL